MGRDRGSIRLGPTLPTYAPGTLRARACKRRVERRARQAPRFKVAGRRRERERDAVIHGMPREPTAIPRTTVASIARDARRDRATCTRGRHYSSSG